MILRVLLRRLQKRLDLQKRVIFLLVKGVIMKPSTRVETLRRRLLERARKSNKKSNRLLKKVYIY